MCQCDVPTFQRNCCPTKPSHALIAFSMHLPFLAGNTATELRTSKIQDDKQLLSTEPALNSFSALSFHVQFKGSIIYIYIIYIYCNTYKLMSSIPLKLLYFFNFYLHMFITLVDYLACARHPPSQLRSLLRAGTSGCAPSGRDTTCTGPLPGSTRQYQAFFLCQILFMMVYVKMVNLPPIHDMLDWENGYSNHGIRGVSCFETSPKEPFLFRMFPWNLCSS